MLNKFSISFLCFLSVNACNVTSSSKAPNYVPQSTGILDIIGDAPPPKPEDIPICKKAIDAIVENSNRFAKSKGIANCVIGKDLHVGRWSCFLKEQEIHITINVYTDPSDLATIVDGIDAKLDMNYNIIHWKWGHFWKWEN